MKLQEQLERLGEDSEEKENIMPQLKNAKNTKASVCKFLKTFDTTIFQTKVKLHCKPLLETSRE